MLVNVFSSVFIFIYILVVIKVVIYWLLSMFYFDEVIRQIQGVKKWIFIKEDSIFVRKSYNLGGSFFVFFFFS